MSDYRVGRGRPPRNWQFKPGQSGNPGGRPKKSSAIDVMAILDEPVTISQEGKTRKMSPAEVTLLRMVKRAIKDEDLHSILYLIERFERYGLLAPLPSAFNSVLRLPNTMPWRMACNMAERFGMPPWNDKQKAIGREHYIATRTEEERAMDEAMGYPDL